jgi:serine protease AprX
MTKIRRTRGVRWGAIATLGGLVAASLGAVVPATAGAAPAGTLGYDTTDLGSMTSVTQIVGAQAAWAKGITGKGVDVALIDTGVAPVPGIDGNRIITGPDLSFDGQANPSTAGIDANGHGTHLAGIIVGRDSGASNGNAKCGTCTGTTGYSDATKFVGVAPDARVVNLKVGAYDGSVDVTQVIAAINWTIQHKNDNGMNIRVLNLAYGTQSLQGYEADPLSYAVEQAWKAGIFVVVAAGNDGVDTDALASPAYNPWVLAVGASDSQGTLVRTDDVVPSFATHGNNLRKVDVIAPAVSLIAPNVPGSFVDEHHFATGGVGTRFIRGSGTSQAAAVASGVAALLYQKYPTATPDQMKKLIMTKAFPLPKVNALYRGRGIVDAAAALPAGLTTWSNTADIPATGTGSIELSRGQDRLAIGDAVLTGERDIFGAPVNTSALATATRGRSSWAGGRWNGNQWTGDNWNNGRWSQSAWTATSWAGTDFADATISEAVWDGSRWSGSRWSGSRWSGSRWSGSRWSGSRWSGAGWS